MRRRGAAAVLAVAVAVLLPATRAGAARPGCSALGRALGQCDPYAPTVRSSWTARVVLAAPLRRGPNGRRTGEVVPTTESWTGGPQQLMVLRSAQDRRKRRWLDVRLGDRPNTADGWILADHARLRRTTWRVVVDRSARTVTVFSHDRVTRRFRAVVGKPSTPTPGGRFAVYARARQVDPHGFIGPWALHLTAHSNVLDNYGGGPGRVAIHGRDGASFADPLGSARSHGCIRIDDGPIRWMAAHLPVGTPVRVR